jgi:hypothetical protein
MLEINLTTKKRKTIIFKINNNKSLVFISIHEDTNTKTSFVPNILGYFELSNNETSYYVIK